MFAYKCVHLRLFGVDRQGDMGGVAERLSVAVDAGACQWVPQACDGQGSIGIEAERDGPRPEIDRSLVWAQSKGVRIDPVSGDIVEG